MTFKGKGECEGAPTVSARLTLARYNLRDRNPALESADERIMAHLRGQYADFAGDVQLRMVRSGEEPAKNFAGARGKQMRLKDQVAIVTGGSRGIGRAIVKALAAEGAKVAFVYRGSQQAAESLAGSPASWRHGHGRPVRRDQP